MTESRTLEHDWFPRPLPSNTVLGERSWLHSAHAFLHYRSTRPCGFQAGHDTGIYVETFFDLGPDAEVSIGNYCTLAGPVVSTNERVSIGDYVLISREVVIADSFAAVPFQASIEGPSTTDIVIEDDVWIGTRAVILGGARLGRGSIIGAGAIIDFEVPAWAVVAGNPARVVGWAKPSRSDMEVEGEQ